MTMLQEKIQARLERGTVQMLRVFATKGGVGLGGILLLLILHLFGLDLPIALGVTLMAVLAYTNGANDVSKVIATLVGSGVGQLRPTLWYGAGCTVIGAACSGLLAAGLVSTFTSEWFAHQFSASIRSLCARHACRQAISNRWSTSIRRAPRT